MLELLTRLDDSAGIENFLIGVLAERGFETRDAAAIVEALSRLEESRLKGVGERLLAGAAAKSFAACANLLRRATQMWAAEDFRAAASHLLAAMPIGQGGEPEWRAPKADPAAMADMLAALRRIDAGAAMRATERMLGAPKTFGFDAVLVPALRLLARQGELAAGDPALEKLRAACLSRLRARAAEPSAPPADWRRPSDLACKCRDCMDFARFLDDPARKMFALKAAEPARSHLEQTIASARSDVDAVTERKGRPYSLVCVKNQASYDRRVVQRKEDIENISVILG